VGEVTYSLTLGEVGKRGLAYFSRLAKVAEATADKPKLIDHATLPCQDATKDATINKIVATAVQTIFKLFICFPSFL
jgi:hypothetical protein